MREKHHCNEAYGLRVARKTIIKSVRQSYTVEVEFGSVRSDGGYCVCVGEPVND